MVGIYLERIFPLGLHNVSKHAIYTPVSPIIYSENRGIRYAGVYIIRRFVSQMFRPLQLLNRIINWLLSVLITKTRLNTFDPLKPHFYTVKLGFTGLYINFLFSAQKRRLWVHVLVRTESPTLHVITKTCLFKYTENFPTKKWKIFR